MIFLVSKNICLSIFICEVISWSILGAKDHPALFLWVQLKSTTCETDFFFRWIDCKWIPLIIDPTGDFNPKLNRQKLDSCVFSTVVLVTFQQDSQHFEESTLFFGVVYIENCHSWTGVFFIGRRGGFWLCKQEISVLYPCCFESVHQHNLRYRLQFGALKWTPALGHTVGSVSSSMLQLWTFFRNEWKSTVKVSS